MNILNFTFDFTDLCDNMNLKQNGNLLFQDLDPFSDSYTLECRLFHTPTAANFTTPDRYNTYVPLRDIVRNPERNSQQANTDHVVREQSVYPT